jgi:glutathione synthase/RimK-type ligase-like ATP-grasp enzyme
MKILIFGHDEWAKHIKNTVTLQNIEINNNRNYHDYDIIIPLREDAIIDCIEKKLQHKSLICYDQNTIQLCRNKLQFQNFMQKYFLNYIPKAVNDTQFPFVLKKKYRCIWSK